MRITNTTIARNYNTTLNRGLNRLNDSMTEVSSYGRKIFKMADDTATGVRAMNVRRSLSQIQGYMDNAENAQSKFTVADKALDTISSIVTTAYERYNYAINGTNDADERNIIADELEQLRNEILSSANVQYSDRYIFGGTNTMSAPFTYGVEANGDRYLMYNNVRVSEIEKGDGIHDYLFSDAAYVDVGLGMTMQGSSQDVVSNSALKNTLNGLDFMGWGDNNLYDTITDMINSLRSGSPDPVTASSYKVADGASAVTLAAGGTVPADIDLEFTVTIGDVSKDIKVSATAGMTQKQLIDSLNHELYKTFNGIDQTINFDFSFDQDNNLVDNTIYFDYANADFSAIGFVFETDLATGNIRLANLSSTSKVVLEDDPAGAGGAMAYLGFTDTSVEVPPSPYTGDGTSGIYGDLLNKIRDLGNNVNLERTRIGSELQYLEYTVSRLTDEEFALTQRQDQLEFRDPAEAIMDYELHQYVYNAALQMGSKLIQPTLFDFIR